MLGVAAGKADKSLRPTVQSLKQRVAALVKLDTGAKAGRKDLAARHRELMLDLRVLMYGLDL